MYIFIDYIICLYVSVSAIKIFIFIKYKLKLLYKTSSWVHIYIEIFFFCSAKFAFSFLLYRNSPASGIWRRAGLFCCLKLSVLAGSQLYFGLCVCCSFFILFILYFLYFVLKQVLTIVVLQTVYKTLDLCLCI